MPRSSRSLPVVAALLLATVTGCGSTPETIDPTGVDGLVIPTPSPEADDFTEGIDNPYLPLVPGSQWLYRAEQGRARVRVTVLEEAEAVAGIEATVVRTRRLRGRDQGHTSLEWFAEDTEGNVWMLGRDGPGTGADWQAGVDGAEAGLAMPAEPRHGDGWTTGAVDGEVRDRIEVTGLAASAVTPYDAFDDVLVLERTTDGRVEERFHAEGVGLVRTLTDDGTELDLADFSRG